MTQPTCMRACDTRPGYTPLAFPVADMRPGAKPYINAQCENPARFHRLLHRM